MMNRKVLVLMANQCEEGEVATLLDILRRAGFSCDGISIEGDIITGQHGCRFLPDLIMDKEWKLYRDYDCLVLPGGWGAADTMAADTRVTELVRYYATQPEKYLAAMCAAPGVLAKAGVTISKTVTSYPGPKLEPLFTNAHYVKDTVAFDDDRHLITSRGPATVLPFAFAIVDALGGDSAFIKQRFLYSELKHWPD